MKKHFLFIAVLALAVTVSAKDKVVLKDGSLQFLFEKNKLGVVDVDLSKAEVVEYDKGDNIKEYFGTYEQYVRSKIDENTETEIKNAVITEMALSGLQASDLQTAVAELQQKKLTEEDIIQFRMRQMRLYKGLNAFNNNNKKGMRFISHPVEAESVYKPGMLKLVKKQGHVFADLADADYMFVFVVDTIDMGTSAGARAANAASFFGGIGAQIAKVAAENQGGVIITGDLVVTDIKTNAELCRLHLNQFKGNAGMTEWSRMHTMMDELFTKELLPLAKKEPKKKKK